MFHEEQNQKALIRKQDKAFPLDRLNHLLF